MFVQAGKLHIQRHHHQHQRRSISNPTSGKLPAETEAKSSAFRQRNPVHRTNLKSTEAKGNSTAIGNSIEGVEYLANLSFPVPNVNSKIEATRSRSYTSKSLNCYQESTSKRSQEGVYAHEVLSRAVSDLEGQSVKSFREEAREYSKLAQSRIEQRSQPETNRSLRNRVNAYCGADGSTKSGGHEEGVFQVVGNGYNTASRCRLLEQVNFQTKPMEARLEEGTSPASSLTRSKPLSGFIGYTLLIGNLIRRHLPPIKSSFSDSSFKYLVLVPQFCVNFITYQLQTLALLTKSGDSLSVSEAEITCKSCHTSLDCASSFDDPSDPEEAASKRIVDKLAWRSREHQFNRSVDVMYSVASRSSRPSRSKSKTSDHGSAHLAERFSLCSIDSEKRSRTNRNHFIGDTDWKRNNTYDRTSGDGCTMEYRHPAGRLAVAKGASLEQQQMVARQMLADRSVASTNNSRTQRSISGGRVSSSDMLAMDARRSQNQVDSSMRHEIFRTSFPAGFETGNYDSPSINQQVKPYRDHNGIHCSQPSQPLPSARSSRMATKPDVWRGSSETAAAAATAVQPPNTCNYFRGNNLVHSEDSDVGRFFFIVEDGHYWPPPGKSLLLANHRNDRYSCNQNSVKSDSELYSSIHSGGTHERRHRHHESPIIRQRGTREHRRLSPGSLQDRSFMNLVANEPGDALKQVQIEDKKGTKQSSVASLEGKTNRSSSSNSGKKSSSYSKLSLAGAKKRLGLKQKGLNSISVQRSEEIVPYEVSHLVRQTTAASLTDSGNESTAQTIIIKPKMTSCNSNGNGFATKLPASFVSGLGEGQIASRQAIVSPYLGDIQLSLSDQRGMLEVEVVRASRLHARAGSSAMPSPFVKLYLIKHRKCLAKFKTRSIKENLNPLYQEKFVFRHDYTDCILQVIVWGDYGRKAERKSLMGIVQIKLNDLDVSNVLVGWYQLFNAPSIVSSLLPSEAVRQIAIASKIKCNHTS